MKNFYTLVGLSLTLIASLAAAGSTSRQSQGHAEGADPRVRLPITADEARALEEGLIKNPDKLVPHEQLISYYFQAGMTARSVELEKKKEQHIFWLIEHHPESELAGSPEARILPIGPSEGSEGYERGKQLWLEQVEKHPNSPAILRNAAEFLSLFDRKTSHDLLEKALALSPNDPMTSSMLAQSLEQERMLTKSPEEKTALAKQTFTLLEGTLSGLEGAERFYALGEVAGAALNSGETVKAELYASELLQSAEKFKKDWNYGNALHKGNVILGRIALQHGDIVSAKQHLLAAGETPGSPQLDSFGPNMTLAKELLEKGERDVVLTYLESCAKFWKMGSDKLSEWRATVKGGGVPDFGANLMY